MQNLMARCRDLPLQISKSAGPPATYPAPPDLELRLDPVWKIYLATFMVRSCGPRTDSTRASAGVLLTAVQTTLEGPWPPSEIVTRRSLGFNSEDSDRAHGRQNMFISVCIRVRLHDFATSGFCGNFLAVWAALRETC
jgi:hypothetical protein